MSACTALQWLWISLAATHLSRAAGCRIHKAPEVLGFYGYLVKISRVQYR